MNVLTPRQTEVWTRIAHGECADAIALTLGVSKGKVRYDIRTVTEKIGAENITHAAAMLVQAGVIVLDASQLPTSLLRDFVRKKLRTAGGIQSPEVPANLRENGRAVRRSRA